MCYFDVILLRDVVSSIRPKISETDTYVWGDWYYIDIALNLFLDVKFIWRILGSTQSLKEWRSLLVNQGKL